MEWMKNESKSGWIGRCGMLSMCHPNRPLYRVSECSYMNVFFSFFRNVWVCVCVCIWVNRLPCCLASPGECPTLRFSFPFRRRPSQTAETLHTLFDRGARPSNIGIFVTLFFFWGIGKSPAPPHFFTYTWWWWTTIWTALNAIFLVSFVHNLFYIFVFKHFYFYKNVS